MPDVTVSASLQLVGLAVHYQNYMKKMVWLNYLWLMLQAVARWAQDAGGRVGTERRAGADGWLLCGQRDWAGRLPLVHAQSRREPRVVPAAGDLISKVAIPVWPRLRAQGSPQPSGDSQVARQMPLATQAACNSCLQHKRMLDNDEPTRPRVEPHSAGPRCCSCQK